MSRLLGVMWRDRLRPRFGDVGFAGRRSRSMGRAARISGVLSSPPSGARLATPNDRTLARDTVARLRPARHRAQSRRRSHDRAQDDCKQRLIDDKSTCGERIGIEGQQDRDNWGSKHDQGCSAEYRAAQNAVSAQTTQYGGWDSWRRHWLEHAAAPILPDRDSDERAGKERQQEQR